MEKLKESLAETPVVDADRRKARLVEGLPSLNSFSGWGPRIVASTTNILRGLN